MNLGALTVPLWVAGATAIAGLLTGYYLGIRDVRRVRREIAREREMEKQQAAARARLRAHGIEWN